VLSHRTCQAAADLAISRGGGRVSREQANPQVGAVDTSATDMSGRACGLGIGHMG
jgi:hypothetical protein